MKPTIMVHRSVCLFAICVSCATGFITSSKGSTLSATRYTVPRPASDGCISSREATFAAASALAVEAPISMLPLSAEVEVISSREAAVSLAGLQREHGSSYVLRWFEEGNPSIFDQTMVSLQSRVLLTGLSPGTSYALRIRTTRGDQEPAELRFCTPQAEGNAEGQMTDLSRLEIRVGRCLEVSKHPGANSLYVEKVDFGEEEPRTIVSGLVAYVSEEEMRGRMVVGLCNLPLRAMRGVESAGMLLCASNEEHTRVDPLSPPPDAKIGELITFEGVLSAPAPPGSAAARAWNTVAEGMRTADDGTSGWEGVPMQTSGGACTSSITGRVR